MHGATLSVLLIKLGRNEKQPIFGCFVGAIHRNAIVNECKKKFHLDESHVITYILILSII